MSIFRSLLDGAAAALAWAGGRSAGEAGGATQRAPVSMACGALWLPATTTWAVLTAHAWPHSGVPFVVAAAVAFGAWWLDRLLGRTQEVATNGRRVLAWACRVGLVGLAGLLGWQALPQWHAADVDRHRQLLAQRLADAESRAEALRDEWQAAASAVARLEGLQEGAQPRALLRGPLAAAQRRAGRCLLQARPYDGSAPGPQVSRAVVPRQIAWQVKADACERLLADVSSLRRQSAAAAPSASRDAARELAAARKLRDAAQAAVATADAGEASLRRRLDACRWEAPRCGLRRAVQAGFIPRWHGIALPLLAVVLAGLPLWLRTLHPAEIAAIERRKESRMAQVMSRRHESMLARVERG